MPYDPRMLQMARMGVGMMGPQPPVFDNPANQPQAQRPKQWWEQPMPPGQASQMGADPVQPGAPKGPPSLFDMMIGLGKMTRPQYDKAIQGPGAYGISPQDAGRLGPLAFLGSMGMPGGAGWGGSGSGGPG